MPAEFVPYDDYSVESFGGGEPPHFGHHSSGVVSARSSSYSPKFPPERLTSEPARRIGRRIP
jgi:hypothetical protein